MKRSPLKRKSTKKKLKKPEKIKMPPKNALGRLAWRMMSLYVRHRDNFICFTCGRKGNDAGHYQHAGKLANWASYDERNINCQCTSCNSFSGGNSVVYARKLVNKYGPNILNEIEETYRKPAMKSGDLIDEINTLDKTLRGMGLDPADMVGNRIGTYRKIFED